MHVLGKELNSYIKLGLGEDENFDPTNVKERWNGELSISLGDALAMNDDFIESFQTLEDFLKKQFVEI